MLLRRLFLAARLHLLDHRHVLIRGVLVAHLLIILRRPGHLRLLHLLLIQLLLNLLLAGGFLHAALLLLDAHLLLLPHQLLLTLLGFHGGLLGAALVVMRLRLADHALHVQADHKQEGHHRRDDDDHRAEDRTQALPQGPGEQHADQSAADAVAAAKVKGPGQVGGHHVRHAGLGDVRPHVVQQGIRADEGQQRRRGADQHQQQDRQQEGPHRGLALDADHQQNAAPDGDHRQRDGDHAAKAPADLAQAVKHVAGHAQGIGQEDHHAQRDEQQPHDQMGNHPV